MPHDDNDTELWVEVHWSGHFGVTLSVGADDKPNKVEGRFSGSRGQWYDDAEDAVLKYLWEH